MYDGRHSLNPCNVGTSDLTIPTPPLIHFCRGGPIFPLSTPPPPRPRYTLVRRGDVADNTLFKNGHLSNLPRRCFVQH